MIPNATGERPPTVSEAETIRFINGWMNETEKVRFLFGANRAAATGTLPPDEKLKIGRLMAENKVDDEDMPALVYGLTEMAYEASAQVKDTTTRLMREGDEGHGRFHWEIKESLLEQIVTRSNHFPTRELEHASPETADNWEKMSVQILMDAMEDGRWTSIPNTLKGLNLAAQYLDRRGEPPTTEAMRKAALHYSDPENAGHEPGCNEINPRMLGADATLGDLEHHVRDRMNATLARGAVSEIEFCKAMLRPYLSPRHMEGFERNDISDEEYREGLISESRTRRALEGDIDNPLVHTRTTYQRVLRDSIAKEGMADRARDGDARGTAESMSRIVNGMTALSNHLQRVERHQQREIDAKADAGNERNPIRWNAGTTHAWQAITQLTKGLTDLAPLWRTVVEMAKLEQRRWDQLHNSEETDHPANLMLIEAAKDIDEALSNLADIENDRRQVLKEEESYQTIIEPALARITYGTATPGVIAMVGGYNQRKAQERRVRRSQEAAHAPTAERTIEDLRRAGTGGDTLKWAAANPLHTARYDRAMRSLAHAGFNLNAVLGMRTKP